jgi:hypothetical protein
MTNKSKEITYFSLFLQVLFGCIYRICVSHTALVLLGCISPDMCIAYTLILSSLVVYYIQVIQGFIHDDHEDLINKHVMMIILVNAGNSVKSCIKEMYKNGTIYVLQQTCPTIFLSRSQYELSRMFSVFSFVKFLSSLMQLFTEFPAFTMFAISCHALLFAPRSYRRGKLCFQNNFSLVVLLQQYNFFSICPTWFR